MTDLAVQRLNMVESQVRPSDVTDRRIIRAMLELPREAFVPSDRQPVAYADCDIDLARAGAPRRALMTARALAKLVQLAAVEPEESVLVVGAATGYTVAVIARLGAKIVAVEEDGALAESARRTLERLGCAGVKVVEGPLAAGAPKEGPFDVILLDGQVEEVPTSLTEQLKTGGRLVAIVGAAARPGVATLVRRTATGLSRRAAFDLSAPTLPGFASPPRFRL